MIFFLCYNDICKEVIYVYRKIVEETFKIKPELYKTNINLNPNTGFMFRHVYGSSENFNVHTHEYYELFLTLKGTTVHCVNNDIQILEPGCLIFIRPNDIHQYIHTDKNDYEFINFTFSTEIAESLLEYLSGACDVSFLINSPLPYVVRLTPVEIQSFIKKIDSFNTVENDDFTAQKLNIRSFLLDIFIKYFINRKNEQKTDIPVWLEITLNKMQKPENFTLGIKRMVQISGKTQEHLARTVKKHLNLSLSEYINGLRLNYAVNLIVNTNLKMTDICYEAGFGNMSCFYTIFKETYNTSPKKFRKSKGMSKNSPTQEKVIINRI